MTGPIYGTQPCTVAPVRHGPVKTPHQLPNTPWIASPCGIPVSLGTSTRVRPPLASRSAPGAKSPRVCLPALGFSSLGGSPGAVGRSLALRRTVDLSDPLMSRFRHAGNSCLIVGYYCGPRRSDARCTHPRTSRHPPTDHPPAASSSRTPQGTTWKQSYHSLRILAY